METMRSPKGRSAQVGSPGFWHPGSKLPMGRHRRFRYPKWSSRIRELKKPGLPLSHMTPPASSDRGGAYVVRALHSRSILQYGNRSAGRGAVKRLRGTWRPDQFHKSEYFRRALQADRDPPMKSASSAGPGRTGPAFVISFHPASYPPRAFGGRQDIAAVRTSGGPVIQTLGPSATGIRVLSSASPRRMECRDHRRDPIGEAPSRMTDGISDATGEIENHRAPSCKGPKTSSGSISPPNISALRPGYRQETTARALPRSSMSPARSEVVRRCSSSSSPGHEGVWLDA